MSDKKYIAIFYQEGKGCDYTIGCGLSVDELRATSRNGAVEEVRKKFGFGLPAGDGEYRLDDIASVSLLEVNCEVEIDLNLFKAEVAEAERTRKAAEVEAQEKAELERLSRKYGGGSPK